ncbi:prolyl-tRNA synthetase [Halalkalibacter hemicellulosilyticusJCM 9152]|uniref:Proline--tRNA ligase n=1 Tax=Halalkalibacter hemicellulosilyticusJCM 9152 TaxID=1236971 RepID=W4QBD7_9BACI|nr:prolyl-tRNA synthetase [Halalkalibacter hemicellulosilyticusJCM 9152]
MRLQDRHERDFVLGATHEEVITSLVRDDIKSYKKLPINVYQIQTKYRDERRPRFGVLRSREFIMKDAYSFDTSEEGLDESYKAMYEAYKRIFSKCGLDFRAVEADSGAIGGTDTHEFMVLSEIGEDTIAYSDGSDFAANIEIAPVKAVVTNHNEQQVLDVEKKETPNVKTIEEVTAFFNVDASQTIKSLLFMINEEPVLILVRGDHEVNEIKIAHLYPNAQSIELATIAQTNEYLGCEPGFIGPLQVKDSISIIADHSVQTIVNGICGANDRDYHFINVNVDRDVSDLQYADIRFIQEGDPSPDGKGTIRFARGIEVGHVFKLGTKYSEALGASFLNEQGKAEPMIMGCYGIGVSRTIAAIVEQNHDENGIVWPKNVSPFDIHLITINMKDDTQRELGEQLYGQLRNMNYDVLFDDRPERAGVKFKDSDLFGLPIRIAIGKRAAEQIVEVKIRMTGEMLEVKVDELESTIKQLMEK